MPTLPYVNVSSRPSMFKKLSHSFSINKKTEVSPVSHIIIQSILLMLHIIAIKPLSAYPTKLEVPKGWRVTLFYKLCYCAFYISWDMRGWTAFNRGALLEEVVLYHIFFTLVSQTHMYAYSHIHTRMYVCIKRLNRLRDWQHVRFGLQWLLIISILLHTWHNELSPRNRFQILLKFSLENFTIYLFFTALHILYPNLTSDKI